MIKTEFSASVFSVILISLSEIILIYWFSAQETFLIIINAENRRAAKSFCGNRDAFSFVILWWIEISKEEHLFEIETICNVINVFTGTLINLMHPCWIKI